MVRNKLRGDGITDDKTMIMERVIALVADLPHQSKLREQLTNTFLTELWDSLEHPPLLYIGDEYKYRSADGSNNVRQPVEPLEALVLTCVEPHDPETRRCGIYLRAVVPPRAYSPGCAPRPRAGI